MKASLSPESEAIVSELITSSAYLDRTAILEEAIALLDCRRQELKQLIEEGINSGPSIPGDVVLARVRARAAEIKERVEARP